MFRLINWIGLIIRNLFHFHIFFIINLMFLLFSYLQFYFCSTFDSSRMYFDIFKFQESSYDLNVLCIKSRELMKCDRCIMDGEFLFGSTLLLLKKIGESNPIAIKKYHMVHQLVPRRKIIYI